MNDVQPTDSFIYYRSFMYATESLSDEDLGKLIRYLQHYAFFREYPDTFKSEHLKSCFELMKPQIMASQYYYTQGKKGGRPRKDQELKTPVLTPDNNRGENPAQNQEEYKEEYKYKKEYKKEHKEEEGFTGSANADPAPSSRSRFVKPTIEEVDAYIKEKGFTFKAEEFLDHYDSNGWKIGGGGSMKDWKASCRTWQRRQNEWHKNDRPNVDNDSGFDYDALIAKVTHKNN